MLAVPLQSIPAQVVAVQVAGQSCGLRVYQKRTGLFCDVSIDAALVVGGVICLNRNRIVRSRYLGLIGDFIFLDTQGDVDPDYTGLGARFVLMYLEEADLAALE